MDSGN